MEPLGSWNGFQVRDPFEVPVRPPLSDLQELFRGACDLRA